MNTRRDFRRLKCRLGTESGGTKVVTAWVERLPSKLPSEIHIYRVLNREGEWGYKTTATTIIEEYIAVTDKEIIYDKPAMMSRKYGWLEIIKQ